MINSSPDILVSKMGSKFKSGIVGTSVQVSMSVDEIGEGMFLA